MLRGNALKTGGLLGSLGTGLAFLFPAPVAQLSAAPQPVALTLRLSSTLELPPVSMAALMAEAQAIWRDAYVDLRWERAAEAEDTTAPRMPALRVVLLAGLVPVRAHLATWKVGELVRMSGAQPLALASITGARLVVDESLPLSMPAPADRDRRIGVVLGRAIAHEVGH